MRPPPPPSLALRPRLPCPCPPGHHQARRPAVRAAATLGSGDDGGGTPDDSDAAYVAKLAAASVAGEGTATWQGEWWWWGWIQSNNHQPDHKPLPSLSGAALIKYGSLAIDAPFNPTGGVALAMTLGPPIVVGAWMALAKD